MSFKMRSPSIIGGIVCLSALSYASPIGNLAVAPSNPEQKRDILIPASLIPTSTVNPGSWSSASWTGTPSLAPATPVVLGGRALPVGDAEAKRDILVPDEAVPTKSVDPNTWSHAPWTGTPQFLPTKAVHLGDLVRRDTTFPDLVPSTTVTLSTDSSATFTGTRKLMPSSAVTLGTTTGCVVSMATYTTGTTVAESYVTSCSDGANPTLDSEQSLITGISSCCGSEGAFYACGEDGAQPTGTV
jgi:hypothetical protein